jgi:hypothetical protein
MWTSTRDSTARRGWEGTREKTDEVNSTKACIINEETSRFSPVPVLNLIKHYAMKTYGGVDV